MPTRSNLLWLALLPALLLLAGCITDTRLSGEPGVSGTLPVATPTTDPNAPSDIFIEGVALEAAPDRIVLTTTLGSEYTVYPHSETVYWAGVNELPVHPDDAVAAVGRVDHTAHTAAANEIYLNFTRITGKVLDVQPGSGTARFTVRDSRRQESFTVELIPRPDLSIVIGNGEVTIDAIPWDAVRIADVIGFVRRDDGVVEGLTIFFAE